MATWDSLRRQTRECENQLEQLLTSFSKLAAAASTSYSSSGGIAEDAKKAYSEIETQVEQGLVKLNGLVEAMSELLDTSISSSTAMQHTAQRHREILADYTRDFRRTQASLREAEARASLLGSVRDEISAFKAGSAQGNNSANDALLKERGTIDSSHRMADELLGQAYETRYEFSRQRGMLSGANSRLVGVLSQVPGINSIIGMINSRRRRDSLIMGGLIGVCVLFLLWYVFG